MIKTPLHSSPTPAPVPSQGYGTGWPSGDHPRVPCLHTASPVFHRSDVSLSTWISESGFVCLGVCCILSGLGSCCEIPGSGNSRGTGCERPVEGRGKSIVRQYANLCLAKGKPSHFLQILLSSVLSPSSLSLTPFFPSLICSF